MAVALDAGFDVAALLARLGVTPRRITADSRDVHPGDAFAAYPGALADGRAYIGDALSRGAGAVLWEPGGFRWNAAWPGGTAPKAQIPGYRVAGKTGTAHKLEGRGYTNRYISSFVGFAPASKPRLVVAVMIDEPSAGQHYGGAVAAPVFSAVTGAA